MSDVTERWGAHYEEQLVADLHDVSVEITAGIVGREINDDRRAWAREELQIADAYVQRRLRNPWGRPAAEMALHVLKDNFGAVTRLESSKVLYFLAALPYTGLSGEDRLAMADACRAAYQTDEKGVNREYDGACAAVAGVLQIDLSELMRYGPRYINTLHQE